MYHAFGEKSNKLCVYNSSANVYVPLQFLFKNHSSNIYYMARYLTHEEVIKSFILSHGNRYDYSLIKYTGNLNKIKIICEIHGIFEQRPKVHKMGHGCPKCSSNYIDGDRHIINQFNEVHNYRYNYSKMNYINDRNKITIICNIHGQFKQSPNNHKKGKGCPKCGRYTSSIKQSMELNEFIDRAMMVHNEYYTYENSVYINNNTDLIITCPIHGGFNQRPDNHLNKKGCSKCRMSKGENEIERLLKERNVEYIQQKTFDELKSDKDRYLRFDFYLPEYNICIEYNGKQHYEPVDFYGGLKSYERRVKLDNKKRIFCEKKKITLIEISYLNKSNIPNIINNI